MQPFKQYKSRAGIMRRYCHQVEGHTVHWIIIVLFKFDLICNWVFFCKIYNVFHQPAESLFMNILKECRVFFHVCSVHLCPVWRLCGCLMDFPLWCMSSGTEKRNGRGTVKHLSFVVYEFWDGEEEWKRYSKTPFLLWCGWKRYSYGQEWR